MSLLGVGSAAFHASTTPKQLPLSALLAVFPIIGQINAPRLLTVTAYFPLGRGPTDAKASTVTLDGVQILEMRFETPSPDFASELALVPYTVEVTYTPSKVGDLPVRMLTSDGVPMGTSVVMTRNANGGVA